MLLRERQTVAPIRPKIGDTVVDRAGRRFKVTVAGLKYLHVAPEGGGDEMLVHVRDVVVVR